MNDIFKRDWKRYSKTAWSEKCILRVFKSRTMRYVLVGRLSNSRNRVIRILAEGLQKYIGDKMGCEISWRNIGTGIVLTHSFGITVNSNARIGEDCTLFKGCTVGSIRGGRSLEPLVLEIGL